MSAIDSPSPPNYDPRLVDHLTWDIGDEAGPTIARAFEASLRIAEEWGVRIDGWLPGGTSSLILTGRIAEREVVLRAALLPWEIEASGPTLLALSGRGGIEVLRYDPATGTTLLPRLLPGDDLSTVPEDQAIEIFSDLTVRLLTAEGDAPDLVDYFRPLYTNRHDRAIARLSTDPIALANRLFETSPSPKLLHGDTHHFNILRHGDEWIAIDPEGVRGDPAYECAAFMRNPIPRIGDEPDLPGLLRHRIDRLGHLLGFSAARIWGWSFVRTVMCVDDPEEVPPHSWVKVLDALDALAPEFEPRL